MTYFGSSNKIKKNEISKNVYRDIMESVCIICGELFEQELTNDPSGICPKCENQNITYINSDIFD